MGSGRDQLEHSRHTSQTPVDLNAQDDMKTQKESSQPKAKPFVSHVRRLREPLSTRNQSTREKIILLRASRVNGMKCPPWGDELPSANDFSLDVTGIYTCVRPLLISTFPKSTVKQE